MSEMQSVAKIAQRAALLLHEASNKLNEALANVELLEANGIVIAQERGEDAAAVIIARAFDDVICARRSLVNTAAKN